MSASIIAPIVISGSHKADGTANASGKVWAYLPNTSTTAQLYSDVDGTLSLTQPLVLDQSGRVPSATAPDGVFTSIPIRLYIEDADGVVVSDSLFTPATGATVSLDNPATTSSDLNEYVTNVQTSTGGKDALYKESGGAKERPIQDKFREQGIWVTDFDGVDPTGVGVSTTGIQNAINRAISLSCKLYFPDGSYKTDQALVVNAATGVQIIGTGHAGTLIKPTNAVANGFTFSSCTGCGIHGLSILHTAGSSGAGVAADASLNFSASDVAILANATYAGFAYGMDFSGNGTIDYLSNCYSINGDTVAVRIANAGTGQAQVISGCNIGASSAAPVSPTSGIEFASATGPYFLTGNRIVGATNNVLFSGTMTSAQFTGNDVPVVLGSVQFSGATAALFPQIGNAAYGYTEDVASGGTFTPNLLKGNHIRVRATSTGAAITIAAPTPAPAAGQYGVFFFLDIFNNAGGALSNPYTMNAAYHLTTVPNQTDLNHNLYLLLWDASASVWRQVSLSVST